MLEVLPSRVGINVDWSKGHSSCTPPVVGRCKLERLRIPNSHNPTSDVPMFHVKHSRPVPTRTWMTNRDGTLDSSRRKPDNRSVYPVSVRRRTSAIEPVGEGLRVDREIGVSTFRTGQSFRAHARAG